MFYFDLRVYANGKLFILFCGNICRFYSCLIVIYINKYIRAYSNCIGYCIINAILTTDVPVKVPYRPVSKSKMNLAAPERRAERITAVECLIDAYQEPL